MIAHFLILFACVVIFVKLILFAVKPKKFNLQAYEILDDIQDITDFSYLFIVEKEGDIMKYLMEKKRTSLPKSHFHSHSFQDGFGKLLADAYNRGAVYVSPIHYGLSQIPLLNIDYRRLGKVRNISDGTKQLYLYKITGKRFLIALKDSEHELSPEQLKYFEKRIDELKDLL